MNKAIVMVILLLLLLFGCAPSISKSKYEEALGQIDELKHANRSLSEENNQLKETIESNSFRLLNRKFFKLHTDSINIILTNQDSIGHTYKTDEYGFITLYEATNQFIAGGIVQVGGPLYLNEGTYQFDKDKKQLTLIYDTQTYVYDVEANDDGLYVERIDAYSHAGEPDFNITPDGIVRFWEWINPDSNGTD